MRVYVGTSGWQSADWRGRFYPDGVPQREWLRFFSERFFNNDPQGPAIRDAYTFTELLRELGVRVRGPQRESRAATRRPG